MKSSGIGGQAVMEGIMMRHGRRVCVWQFARKPDGEIVVKKEDISECGIKCAGCLRRFRLSEGCSIL